MPERLYSPEEKREALKQYLLLGTYQKVSEATGISVNTLRGWKHHEREWWDLTQNELITELEGDYRPGWMRVLGKAMEAIEDRIDGGDYVLTKEGIVRVPVKGKELGVIMGIAADKLKQFAVKPVTVEDAGKRRKDLAELAKEDRKANDLARMPVNAAAN